MLRQILTTPSDAEANSLLKDYRRRILKPAQIGTALVAGTMVAVAELFHHEATLRNTSSRVLGSLVPTYLAHLRANILVAVGLVAPKI
ncbi:uncharacterized protein PHALS_06901 [Plasmopara halstedii]|uniref:Uncharacterized protein n=1 Tax=Plasmopara halstedii TaxID=4781 RepID=A0A0P1B316_PLAHL|nr:uncharacterized protein PHALS_06901 [Plasmopara halstedii]CEG49119.1 hypothetical protein PHALS_06901 [Plasmopara halstedii]|eukprot:XP_024585488.1 hypothetical protein PHALS_06901 [Plasmopara halstedii]